MKYSLIVPLYNRENTIKACLDSLMVQEETDYEIIIVDDGSTDGSGKIADEYSQKYPFIKVIHKENGGLSSARNEGVKYANGQYVLFPDSDDEYLPNLLSYLNKFFGNDLICFGHFIEYQSKVEEKAIVKEDITTNQVDLKEALYLIENVGAFNVAWNKAYKKELIIDLLFENLMPAEDLVFNCNYYLKCKSVALIKEKLYRYMRKEDVSLATKYNKNLLNVIEIANEKRQNLYNSVAKDDVRFSCLFAKKYVGYAFSVVPNIFRKNNGLKAKEKYQQLKALIKNKELKKQIKTGKLGGFNGKTFYFLVKLNNGVIAYNVYSVLFFIRNNFSRTYRKLRRK